jgi:hypothetical protein
VSEPRGDQPGEPPRDLPQPAVLAVDGGNSKTDVALVAADGTLLASARGPGVPGMLDPEETLRVLGSLARAAATQAGLSPGGPGPRIAQHLSACVANADLPEEERELDAALRAEGWSDSTTPSRCCGPASTGLARTGASGLPAGRGSTAWAWRRTGGPPGISRSAR